MIKDGEYVNNLDEYKSTGTHWITLYMNSDNVTCFDSFRVEHVSKGIKKIIDNKNIINNFLRIKAYDPVICGHFCMGFIDFMLASKSLLEYTNLISPNK